jgi:hypothetical protein
MTRKAVAIRAHKSTGAESFSPAATAEQWIAGKPGTAPADLPPWRVAREPDFFEAARFALVAPWIAYSRWLLGATRLILEAAGPGAMSKKVDAGFSQEH